MLTALELAVDRLEALLLVTTSRGSVQRYVSNKCALLDIMLLDLFYQAYITVPSLFLIRSPFTEYTQSQS